MASSARLLRLSPGDWLALVGAALALLAVELGLRTLGYARLGSLLQPAERSRRGPAHGEIERRTRRLAWALGVAARHHLRPMRCLHQALALLLILRLMRLPAGLRIGVRTDAGALEAHAWVEYAGEPL